MSVNSIIGGPISSNFILEKEVSDTVDIISTVVIPKGFKLDDSRKLLIFEHSDGIDNNVNGKWELYLGDLTSNALSFIAAGVLQNADQNEEDSFTSAVPVIGDGSTFLVVKLTSFGNTWSLNNGGIRGVRIPIARN